jgi:hypothetical protein
MLDADGDVGFAREHLLDSQLLARERSDLVEGHHVRRIGHRDEEGPPLGVVAHRQHVVAARHLLGHERDRGRIDDGVLEVDGDLSQRLRQDVADRGLGHEPQLHEDLAQGRLEALLLRESDVQLVLADDALAEERLPERDLREGCRCRGHGGLRPYGRSSAMRRSTCAESNAEGRPRAAVTARP